MLFYLFFVAGLTNGFASHFRSTDRSVLHKEAASSAASVTGQLRREGLTAATSAAAASSAAERLNSTALLASAKVQRLNSTAFLASAKTAQASAGFWDPGVPNARPNILFIVLDDLGSFDLGYKNSGIETPHIDALAKESVVLSKYYVLPSCSPTRAAFMAGRYPLHTGINSAIPHHSTYGLPVDEETLPEMLRRAGYRTHAVGKWHIGHAAWEYTPTFRGFDSFFGFYNGGEDHFHHTLEKAYGLRRDVTSNCGPGCSQIADERGNYSTHVYTREAVRIVREHEPSSGPLFLYLAYQAVHFPTQAPPRYWNRYSEKGWDHHRAVYAGMLTAVDEGIGEVRAALHEKNLVDDLLIVVTTDNGGPTEACAVQGSSNWPRRGGKCTIFEGGVAGDAFIWGWPFPAATNTNLFHAVDWLPTFAELLAVMPAGKPLDGVSQLRSLRGGAPARSEIYYGVTDQQVGTYGPAIRVGRWKLVEGRCGPPRTGGWHAPWYTQEHEVSDNSSLADKAVDGYQLFDLEADPEERNNVATDFADWVQELKERLEWYKAGGVPQVEDGETCEASPKFLQHEVLGMTWEPWCWRVAPRPAEVQVPPMPVPTR